MPTTNINVGKGQNLTPDITLVGDWDAALKLIGYNLKPAVLLGARNGQIAAAEKIQSIVKANIRRGGPEGTYWPSYSYLYEKKKAKKGGGDKFWRWTDTYYKSIEVNKKGPNITVGVPKYERGRVNKNPLTLGQIATILERGSKANNIAARPLWGPSFKQFGGKTRVAYHINFHIRKQIFLATGMRGIKF